MFVPVVGTRLLTVKVNRLLYSAQAEHKERKDGKEGLLGYVLIDNKRARAH
jgi:hypothetical protein